MSTVLKKIAEVCAENRIRPGSDATIALVSICGVVSIPKPTFVYDELNPDGAYTITEDIVLKEGYHFVEWTGRKKDADYKAEVAGEEDAEFVNVTMSMYVPLIEAFKSWLMNQTINARYLVLTKDRNNDNWRIVGEIGNGVRIKFTEQVKPKNGYVLEMMVEELDDLPYFYAGAVPLV